MIAVANLFTVNLLNQLGKLSIYIYNLTCDSDTNLFTVSLLNLLGKLLRFYLLIMLSVSNILLTLATET